MDGENSSLYRETMHARSLTSSYHESRTWLKRLWGSIKQDIPAGWRICGENLYAKHSIAYNELSTYFMVFSIWDEHNVCLDWESTVQYSNMLGLQTVPVLWEGVWDEDAIKNCWNAQNNNQDSEGYVVRLRDAFHYNDFSLSLAKYVRKGHVQTGNHWAHEKIVPNILKEV